MRIALLGDSEGFYRKAVEKINNLSTRHPEVAVVHHGNRIFLACAQHFLTYEQALEAISEVQGYITMMWNGNRYDIYVELDEAEGFIKRDTYIIKLERQLAEVPSDVLREAAHATLERASARLRE